VKRKNGMSMLTIAITITVLVIIAGIFIAQIDNVIKDAEKSEFTTELSTIKSKVKEHYLLSGSLPVKPGVEYTLTELKSMLANQSEQALLENEITENDDTHNSFLVIDLDALEVQTNNRGQSIDNADIFVVATNTLNVYYLKGTTIDNTMRFSLVTLVESNEIEGDEPIGDTEVSLQNELVVTKNTNLWTNELKVTVTNVLSAEETLKYFIDPGDIKEFPANNTLVLNASELTNEEKDEFNENKQITIQKELNGVVTQTKQIEISNLDMTSPSLGEMEMVDGSSEDFNVIKINSSDLGGSGIKCIYYDYNTVLLNNVITSYYLDRSDVNASELISFVKITNDSNIKLDKNIKSIVAMAVDNAGNVSAITTYTLEDEYLTSK